MKKFICNFLLWLGASISTVVIVQPAGAQNVQGGIGKIASLSYTLDAAPDTLKINSVVTYTIQILNRPDSDDPLDSVTVIFKIPQLTGGTLLLDPTSFILIEGDPPVGYPNAPIDIAKGEIRWELGSLFRSAPRKIVFSLKLGDISATTLQSCGENYFTATLEGTALDGGKLKRPGSRAAESVLDVRPDMELGSISGSASAQRGRVVDYTIGYKNIGNVGGVATLCVKLPMGAIVDNVSVAPPDTQIIITKVGSDSLCLNVGLVPADSLLRSFILRVQLQPSIPLDVDSLCMSAIISAPCDTNKKNDGPQERCLPLDPLDLLFVDKAAAPSIVTVGDTVNYIITYANVDVAITAHNVQLTDRLPVGTQFIAADTPVEFSNNMLIWRFDSLTAGAAGQRRYSVRVPLDFYRDKSSTVACAGDTIKNFVEFTATGPGGTPSPEAPSKLFNNQRSILVVVRPLVDLLSLAVRIDTTRVNPAAASLVPGDILTYHLRFRNNSARLTATAAILTDTLPDPQIVTLLQPLPPQFIYEPAGNRLIGRNLVLAPGQADSVAFRVMVRTDITSCTELQLLNRAGIFDSLEFDCNLANNNSRETRRVLPTGDLLAVNLAASPGVVSDTLGQVNFTLDYRNTGTIDALNVVVRDSLPRDLEFVSSAPVPSGSAGNNVFFWEVGTLARGDSGTILINARVRRGVVACDSIRWESRARISSSPADCNLGNNEAATTVTLLTAAAQQPQLVMVQPADFQEQNGDGCAESGELITAQFRFRNMSLITATQVDTSQMRATLATIQSFSFAPSALPPGEIGIATFQLRAGQSDRLDSLAIAGRIAGNGFCPRPLQGAYCLKPRARVDFIAAAGRTPLSISDRNGNRNGCADDNGGEPLDVVILYQNVSTIPADSVDLKVVIAPPGFALLNSNRNLTRSGAAGDTFKVRVTLAAGQIDSLILQIRYADFNVQQVMVSTTTSLRVSAIAAPVVQTSAITICRNCYARPNPFIPSRHIDPALNMHGVRFAPNDGQEVEIFDLQGNRVRRLNTRETWNGKDDNGRNCPAGVYLWVIKGEGGCRGTIVVVW